MGESIYPNARKNGLLISQIGLETIVYDTESDGASCLDQLTTAVWKACDGTNDIASILGRIKNEAFEDANEQIILMAIDQLEQAGLLEGSPEIDEQTRSTLNRRDMLRLLGAKAAAVLPVITTIVVPPAIHAASLGGPCNRNDKCPQGSVCCGRSGNATTGTCTQRRCPPGHIIP